jgi:hypothetical protein
MSGWGTPSIDTSIVIDYILGNPQYSPWVSGKPLNIMSNPQNPRGTPYSYLKGYGVYGYGYRYRYSKIYLRVTHAMPYEQPG